MPQWKRFAYGSLQPGGPNQHILAEIGGGWGRARGTLVHSAWGSNVGYPALVLNEEGNRICGYLFRSNRLMKHWAALDQFEGEDYERVLASTELLSGQQVEANVYVLDTT